MKTLTKSLWTLWMSPVEKKSLDENQNLTIEHELKNPFSVAIQAVRGDLRYGRDILPA